MRSKTVAAFINVYASRLFCLGVAFTSFTVAGCGSTGASIGGGGTTTTVTSVTLSPATATIAPGGTASFTASVAGANNPSQVVTWSVSPATAGTITSAGVFTAASTITATMTATIMAASTVPEYTNVTGTATVTINSVPPVVTSVSLACAPPSITDIQTTICTPTVTGAGAFTNTVNLTVSPASAGTLSASSEVSSGTEVTFTPTFAGVATPTVTATSTSDSTKSGTAQVTVTLRTVTISSATGNIWLAKCSELFTYRATQTGIVAGDTLHLDPYQPDTFTATPASTFTITMGIGNNPHYVNACSPGAYDEYVTGTDGARSNDQYIPILSPWNMWAGYNSTDEFQADFAGQTTCKYRLSDGTQDGECLPGAGLVSIVDGGNLIGSFLGNGGIVVYDAATGTHLINGNNRSGDIIADVAAKNGIIGYTTNQEESFFLEELGGTTITDVQNVGTAPTAITMSTGCGHASNGASAFSYDQAGSSLYRSDAVGNTSAGTVTASLVNSVPLSGFSPASGLPNNLARYVVAWDSSCKAAVLAPVLTGGTNPDGTPAYEMEFALVDMTSGSARQLGTYVTGIPSTAIRMAADPSGNDVVIASTNQSAGTTVLTQISWTLDANENPTFSVTTLGSAPPTGVYGVSLGILPNDQISVGQRQQHYVLANQ